MELTYVLPIRCRPDHGVHDELVELSGRLSSEGIEVLVVDNSDEPIYEAHERAFGPRATHVRPTRETTNGKVGNVLTGIELASNERVIVADDDVRHDAWTIAELARRLEDADVVVPANAFAPLPWHARWDSGRTLLNRSLWMDYPGTLAVRRSSVLAAGGYDGDVLFENLELIRTIRANGGRVSSAPDVIVPRRPPSTRAFLGQRVRQAYDDLAQPAKLAVMLCIAPSAALAISRRAWRSLATATVGVIALGELGRRRDGGASAFPPTAALWSPLWLAERAVCIWLAVARRALLGGVRYRGSRLRRAATPMRELRRRAIARQSGRAVERAGAAA